jgi:hypothetical protein
VSHTCGQRCYQTRGNSKLALSYIAAKRAEVVWSIGVWRQLVYTQRGAQRRFALRRGIRRHLAKVNAGRGWVGARRMLDVRSAVLQGQ